MPSFISHDYCIPIAIWHEIRIILVEKYINTTDMQKGKIGVTTENIFPVIKQFLYSDHEIFLREIVSNAVDATQKIKTLAARGDFKGELGDLTVRVSVDKDNSIIKISDRGVGMTAEEIDKYINQIAFSGANDFLEKYKKDANAIIGHFGLGFYSAFMVSKQVDIITRSYKDGAQAMKWSCDGSPEFELVETEKDDRGTDIILLIDDDSKEFLEKSRIQSLLTKYCRFLPVPIAFGKKTEWKDGKEVDTAEDNIINDTTPIWTRKPSELKDEDYLKFYRALYPMADDPLFWIHLNVDYPFTLTGVLYFPKIRTNLDLQRNKIQLYCNQVFVTDNVENIVPDFLTLLHGVIDSPDIPLNVSRSYLQADSNVKKISTYITKKVSDRLQNIFKEDRKNFEGKWDDLKLFINYGMLSQPDFYDRAKDFSLLKDVDGKYYTLDEYRTLIKDNQTDKDGNVVYLYANDKEKQYTYIANAKAKGYSVLLLDGQLDTAMVNLYEQKIEKTRFSRVDSDSIDRLIMSKDNENAAKSTAEEQNVADMFSSQIPKLPNVVFHVDIRAAGENAAPVVITQSEYMRRMKELSHIESGMQFYGQMPDEYAMILNSDHRLIKEIKDEAIKAVGDALAPVDADLKGLEARMAAIRQSQEKKKADEITDEDRKQRKDCEDEISKRREERKKILADFAAGNKPLHQLIDLALLENHMLSGEALAKFVTRSIDMIK